MKLFGASFWVMFAIGAALAIGWIMNIVAIVNSNFNDITGLLVMRIIGVFIAPLGAILGYF